MSAIEPGLKYRLIPIVGGVRVVDGVVEVLRVGPIGPNTWATVTGRVIVPDDQLEDGEQPGLVEDQVFIVRADRLGEVVRVSPVLTSAVVGQQPTTAAESASVARRAA